MSPDARRLFGAVASATAAGSGLTALMMLGEKKTGAPSELTDLGRRSADKLGQDTPPADRLPSAGEQAVTQGGHLLLSAMAGAAYAAVTDEDTPVVPGGVAFGLAFYGLAHWVTGPLLGVKQPEWRSGAGTVAMHAANHLAFGLATAAAADVAGRSHRS